jgi:hypothetical protein
MKKYTFSAWKLPRIKRNSVVSIDLSMKNEDLCDFKVSAAFFSRRSLVNSAEMGDNPAVFRENPAEMVKKPAVFSDNSAEITNNPAN